MVKRKLNLPTPSTKRRGDFWSDFKNSFFGTISDPIGTIVSLAKNQQPSWNRNRSWKNISTFDSRKGFIGGLLSSFGINYLKDALTGGLNSITRKDSLMKYNMLYRHPYNKHELMTSKSIFPLHHFDSRAGAYTDIFYNLLQNKTVRDLGKKALVSAAGVVIPKAISYITNKYGAKKKKNY